MDAPFWSSHNGESTLTLYQGDVLEVLRQMPAESVHCVVTSPPYWGLRDYGTGTWEGGDTRCDHTVGPVVSSVSTLEGGKQPAVRVPFRGDCGKCGARRIDNQIGLEKTPEEYVAKMVEVFREVKRVLRQDGTLWLNMGDAYASGGVGRRDTTGKYAERRAAAYGSGRGNGNGPREYQQRKSPPGLKPKDLLGMPWRVAFALQADGWWLRSDIIWSKPNPMPESVTDRPTKAHEYIFLLTKAATYYYDADAVRDPQISNNTHFRSGTYTGGNKNNSNGLPGGTWSGEPNPSGRNKRTVWEIATEPYPEAHFATFPQKLVEPCILAGTSEKGCCPECGAPWERVTEKGDLVADSPEYKPRGRVAPDGFVNVGMTMRGSDQPAPNHHREILSVGWQPTCAHGKEPVPSTVLDPFAGSGTTLLVAQRLGRNGIGIDLSEPYCHLAVKRLEAEHAQMKLVMG